MRSFAYGRSTLRQGGFAVASCLVSFSLVPACYEVEPLVVEEGVVLEVDSKGAAVLDELGIVGHWYAYGDGYGEIRTCADIGGHPEEVCSEVAFPPAKVPTLDFPNFEGKMCTSGVAARVRECCPVQASEALGAGGAGDGGEECVSENSLNCSEVDADHSNLWGAGIGFDLRLPLPETRMDGGDEFERDFAAVSSRKIWNASEHKIKGISFQLEWHGEGEIPLRVEFPMKIDRAAKISKGTLRLDGTEWKEEELPAGFSTEEHSSGSPFYRREDDSWTSRPRVQQGRNVILWQDVFPPPLEDEDVQYQYLEEGEFDGDHLFGIQFHVFTSEAEETPFSFCVSDLTFLRE